MHFFLKKIFFGERSYQGKKIVVIEMFCCHLNVFGCEFTSLVSDHELNGSLYESFCLHLDVESQVLSSLMLKVVASTLAFDDSCDESNAVHVLICRL